MVPLECQHQVGHFEICERASEGRDANDVLEIFASCDTEGLGVGGDWKKSTGMEAVGEVAEEVKPRTWRSKLGTGRKK